MIADVGQRADVRVGEGRDAAGLALEALAADRIAAQFGVEQLDGDGAAQPRVAGPLHLAHAAFAEPVAHDYIRETIAGRPKGAE